jgi:hypothetical protein
MSRTLMALALYVGLTLLFVVVVLALASNASILTAVTRGITAMAVVSAMGILASLAVRTRPEGAEKRDERGSPS